jgi:hypothetical protein
MESEFREPSGKLESIFKTHNIHDFILVRWPTDIPVSTRYGTKWNDINRYGIIVYETLSSTRLSKHTRIFKLSFPKTHITPIMLPITRSINAFCQGLRGAESTSSMPMLWTRFWNWLP